MKTTKHFWLSNALIIITDSQDIVTLVIIEELMLSLLVKLMIQWY